MQGTVVRSVCELHMRNHFHRFRCNIEYSTSSFPVAFCCWSSSRKSVQALIYCSASDRLRPLDSYQKSQVGMKRAFVRILVLAVATFQGIIAAPARFELSMAAKSSNQTDPARTSLPSPLPAADQSAEKTFIKKNGLLPPNVKTKYGMAMNATSGPPASPKPMMLSSNFGPTSAVVKDLEFYTSLAAATYCSDVQSKKWTCKQCKVVPDGKLVLSFATAKYDTVGYVLQSVSRKAIYIAFRGMTILCNQAPQHLCSLIRNVGTNSIESVIADIQFALTPYPPVPGAKIHRGMN